MKKIFSLIMLTLGLAILAACASVANKPPVLAGEGFDETGFKEVTILEGEAFNPLDGITAQDDKDGNLLDQVVVSGWEADYINQPGTHTITLSVTDSGGLTASLTIRLIVESEDLPPIFVNLDAQQTYFIGSGDWDALGDGLVKAYENADLEGDEEAELEIEVRDTPDLTTAGTYIIRLRVRNTAGVVANATIILSVVDSGIPEELPTGPVVVEMWHAMGNDITTWIRKQATAFREEHLAAGRDYTVNVADGTGNYDQLKDNMINAINERKLPNLIQGYPDHVSEYLNGRAILNLTPYVNHKEFGLVGNDAIADVVGSYLAENSQYDALGTYYSMPFNKSTEVLLYNRDALKDVLTAKEGITEANWEEHLPETWQDWFALSDELIAWGAANALPANRGENNALIKAGAYDSVGNAFITLTRQFGGAYTEMDYSTFRGVYLWNDSPQTKAAMQFFKDNKDAFTIPEFWDQDYSTTPFSLKQMAYTISSSAGARHTQSAINGLPEDQRFEMGALPVPYDANNPELRQVIQQGTNISVTDSGTNEQKLVAWLFIKYLMRTEVTVDFAIETGYFPVRTSGYSHPTYLQFLDGTLPGMTQVQRANALSARVARLQADYFFFDPAFVGSSRARTLVGEAFEQILVGDGNIDVALAEAHRQANLGN